MPTMKLKPAMELWKGEGLLKERRGSDREAGVKERRKCGRL
jgi:hypothetical protein